MLSWSLRRLLDPRGSWGREAGDAGLSEQRVEAGVEAGMRVAAQQAGGEAGSEGRIAGELEARTEPGWLTPELLRSLLEAVVVVAGLAALSWTVVETGGVTTVTGARRARPGLLKLPSLSPSLPAVVFSLSLSLGYGLGLSLRLG